MSDIAKINVRDEIVKAIAESSDQKDRAFLALMLRFADHVERLFADDEMLRKKVLNGDYETHAEDHEYITNLKKSGAIHAIDWVNDRISKENNDKQTFKNRWEKMIEGIISELPKIVVYAALTLAGYGYLVAK
jgi:hypothetical protein